MREKTVKLKGNNSFFWHNLILLLLLLGSIFFSILDAHFRIIPWPQGYENIIGVSSQIITAIATLVASIIGIAISLQNEEFFGVKLTKLYSLRVRKHYPILKNNRSVYCSMRSEPCMLYVRIDLCRYRYTICCTLFSSKSCTH